MLCTNCSSVLANSTSPAGATVGGQCLCKPGYYGVDCEPCPADSYCPGGALASVVGFTSVSASSDVVGPLISCGPGRTAPPRSSFAGACVCQPGYGGSSCDPCPAGTFSAGGNLNPCTPCGASGQTGPPLANSNNTCYCLPGYGKQLCLQCPANTYARGGSKDECLACPLNSSGPAGSSDAAECGKQGDGSKQMLVLLYDSARFPGCTDMIFSY